MRGYVGLGSNLGEREALLRRALEEMEAVSGLQVLRVSSFRQTAPEGFVSANQFLNAVAEVEWQEAPANLLDVLQLIEHKLGRARRTEPGVEDDGYEDRCIDLDIIWLDGVRLDTPGLKIPHPRAGQRDFVLSPLAELNPALAEALKLGQDYSMPPSSKNA